MYPFLENYVSLYRLTRLKRSLYFIMNDFSIVKPTSHDSDIRKNSFSLAKVKSASVIEQLNLITIETDFDHVLLISEFDRKCSEPFSIKLQNQFSIKFSFPFKYINTEKLLI